MGTEKFGFSQMSGLCKCVKENRHMRLTVMLSSFGTCELVSELTRAQYVSGNLVHKVI